MTEATNFELAFARAVLRHSKAVITLALLAVLACAAGALKLKFTNSYRVFFQPDNPELLAFDRVEQTFARNDNVMFVVSPPGGEVFSAAALAAIRTLTERAWQLPYATRVDSVTNFQYSTADGDTLQVRDLVGEPSALEASALATLKATALAEPQLAGNLLALDARTTAVNVTFLLPRQDELHEVPSVVTAARALARQLEQENPGLRIRLTGVLMMDYAFTEASLHDATTLVASSFALMLGLAAWLLGGPLAGVGTGVVLGLAIAAAMGLAGHLGYPVSPPISVAPIIILTVAIANCVHVLAGFKARWAAGRPREAALVEAVATNLKPIFLASLTTVIGFLSFNFSDVPPFRQLGNVVAFGDLTSYVLSVTLLPALVSLLPLRPPPPPPAEGGRAGRLAAWVLHRRQRLLVGLGAAALALAACLPLNRLNDVFLHYFDHTIPFRADADYTVEHLTGLYHLQYLLAAPAAGGVSEPAFLQALDGFTGWLRVQPEVRHVSSLADTLKRLNRNMHGDAPSAYRLPDTRDLAAQYLLLYEMSLPYGLDLNNQIDVDKSAVRLGVAIRTLSSAEAIAFNERAEAWVRANAPAVSTVEGTGAILMFSFIGERNIRSMLAGSGLALLVISALLLLMLKSWKLGLVSLAPNLLPPVMGFGLWGLTNGEIGLSLSLVTSMTLGIIIDDTVHFLVQYQRARRRGDTAYAAVAATYRDVAPAMAATSAILMAGFLVLALSHFELNAGMGLMTALVIGIAMLMDLFFLPPLLLAVERKHDVATAGPAARAGA